MAVTMQDVARHAGVSVKSVSNYVNDYPYMTESMRAKIESAISTLGYKLNVSARNLRSGRTGNIALVIPEIGLSYFAELAESVISAAQHEGLNVFVETTGYAREHELQILAGERGPFVDGVILESVRATLTELREARPDFPLVVIGDRAAPPGADFVTMANVDGAHAATAHLLAQGRRRIVALGGEFGDEPSAPNLRTRGYRRAHAEAGVPVDDALVIEPASWHRPEGAGVVERLIEQGVAFDAVFGFNDALAIGALSAVQRAGLRVPEDVAVIGFDNTQDAIYTTPALTSIDPSPPFIAARAVELLVQRMGGSVAGPVEVVADYRLVLRESA